MLEKLKNCERSINNSNLFVDKKYNLPIDVFLNIISFIPISQEQSETCILFYLQYLKNRKLLINNNNIKEINENGYRNNNPFKREFSENIEIMLSYAYKRSDLRHFIKNRLNCKKLIIYAFSIDSDLEEYLQLCQFIFKCMESSKKTFNINSISIDFTGPIDKLKKIFFKLPDRNIIPHLSKLSLVGHCCSCDCFAGYKFKVNETYNSIRELITSYHIYNHQLPSSLKHLTLVIHNGAILEHYILDKIQQCTQLTTLSVYGTAGYAGKYNKGSLKRINYYATLQKYANYFELLDMYQDITGRPDESHMYLKSDLTGKVVVRYLIVPE